jgi:DNA-binding GntR family transcriptional regulator
VSSDIAAGLALDRALLDRTGTAERVAGVLRDRITEGYFPPGTRLSEEAIGAALGISRNTLREAFRLLSHERLLVHELNRGVFVRVLTAEDVIDLYRVRRLVECAAVRHAKPADPDVLSALRDAVAEGDLAVGESRWRDIGTANMRFHRGLSRLAGSPRVDELMGHVLAELRLVFHVMKNPRAFHEPYVARNREIIGRLEAGDSAGAERLLAAYLDDAESQLLRAYSPPGA